MGTFPEEFNETSGGSFALHQALDHMLDEGKDPDKDTEDHGFQKGGINQGLLFKPVTEVENISNHDDFCKNRRFDQGYPVIRVSDIIGSQNESSVPGKGAEYEDEVKKFYPVLR